VMTTMYIIEFEFLRVGRRRGGGGGGRKG